MGHDYVEYTDPARYLLRQQSRLCHNRVDCSEYSIGETVERDQLNRISSGWRTHLQRDENWNLPAVSLRALHLPQSY